MLPAFAVSASPIATSPTTSPFSGQTARARRSKPMQVAAKVRVNRRKSPAESPRGRLASVEQHQVAAMRVEGVERPDERIVGKERRVLPVQEQREPVRLIVVTAVIPAQGQVQPEDQENDRASGAG